MVNKYVVVGANSFSGSHLVARLLAEGREVLGISRSPEPQSVFLPYSWGESKGRYLFVQADLNKNVRGILEKINTFQPEVVVNFAAQGMVGESWKTPWDWYQTNMVGLAKFVDGMRNVSSLERYVHVSTPEVYGSTEGWAPESWDFSPSSPYATSRAAGDWHLKNLYREFDFPLVITRSANVYGPGQQLYRIIPRAFIAAILGKPMDLHGGGNSLRSFIHIDDVVEGTLRVARSGNLGEVYHFSTENPISIWNLVKEIFAMCSADFDSLVTSVSDRVGKDAKYLLNSEKARTELGWQDTRSLAQGLESVRNWVDKHRETIQGLPMVYQHRK